MSRWQNGGKWQTPARHTTDANPVGRAAVPRAWCYVCATPHYWAEACPPVPQAERRTRHTASK